MRTRRSGREDGFALLLVFAMAAAMACLLYLELPRVAFESQRGKEELLVDRGEQYVRGIRMFMLENRRAPQNLEELEKFNNKRYLRRRYKDPMTGDDEWRLIHMGANGMLADSLIDLKKKDANGDPSVLAANIQGVGQSATTESTDPTLSNNPGLMRRASDRLTPTGLGTPDASGQDQNPPNQEESRSGPVGTPVPVPPGGLPMPGMPGAQGPPGPGGRPIGVYPVAPVNLDPNAPPGTTPAQPGSAFGSNPAFGGNVTPGGTPGQQPTLVGGAPGSGGGQQVNQATDMIRNILTTPRAQPNLSTGGTVFGAGLAGVASKKDGDAIKIYKEQTNYKLWEFVFDPQAEAKKQQNKAMPAQLGNPNQPGQPTGTPGSQP